MSFRRPSRHYLMRTPGLKPSSGWWQRGVYALEYAIVFPVFFMILYAVISYGIVFAIHLSLQYAAEEGARAALQYQASSRTRLERANVIATGFLDTWLPSDAYTVDPRICRRDIDDSCWGGSGSPPICTSQDPMQACLVEVVVEYDYLNHAIAPSIPGFGLIMPDRLSGRAALLLERSM